MYPVSINTYDMLLLPQRGLFLPASATLVVADTHFGKDDHQQCEDTSITDQRVERSLVRIEEMIETTNPEQLIHLGDLLQTRSSISDQTHRSLAQFFELCDGIEIVLTIGNHDESMLHYLDDWPVEQVHQYRIGDLEFAHRPIEGAEGDIRFCGHLHPSVEVTPSADEAERLPCFWQIGTNLVLPALGNFIGIGKAKPRPGRRVWAIADADIFELQPTF